MKMDRVFQIQVMDVAVSISSCANAHIGMNSPIHPPAIDKLQGRLNCLILICYKEKKSSQLKPVKFRFKKLTESNSAGGGKVT